MNNIIIREERTEDYRETELVVMRAFWNIHGPGCNEHLLVNKLRSSKDYLPELSRVAELDGKIVGVIMYTKAKVIDVDKVHEVLTFGPLAVEPTAHSMGIGGLLMKETFKLAREAGYPGICIFGEPRYYPRYGFADCERYGITDMEGNNYDAFMGYEFFEGAFNNIKGKFKESDIFEECEDENEIEEFSKAFPSYKKLKLKCQWLHEEKLGRISSVSKNSFTIRFWEKEIPAKLSGKFYYDKKDSNKNKEFPVVGDYVTFKFNPNGESRIFEVCERSSVLSRLDMAGHSEVSEAVGKNVRTAKEQIMVANVDYVFIVTSLNANFNVNRIVRYVSAVNQGNAIPIVVLTKSDICDNYNEFINEVKDFIKNVEVHAVSSYTDEGMDKIMKYLEPDKTIALLGSSGVGKSTLINRLTGSEVMKTGGIRESDSKGHHTTTYRQMIVLKNGTTIIDTPGMREFGMIDAEEGINETFEDIKELESMCRFNDCTHKSEPGCAIKNAIADGSLTEERYNLYLSLRNENRKNVGTKAIAKARRKM